MNLFLVAVTITVGRASAFVPNNVVLIDNPIIVSSTRTNRIQQQQQLPKTSSLFSNIDDSQNNSDNNKNNKNSKRTRLRDMVRDVLRRLATLSLKDYEWRSNVFKTNEADRSMEESLARMMGEDEPAYIRPMDASKKGPLGATEEKVVTWLSDVIEEEGKRAQQIVSTEGELIRPMESDSGNGPLGQLEEAAVTFVDSIRTSEQERVKDNNLLKRPKDVDKDKRGPLGNAEAMVMETVEKIAASERKRQEMIKETGEVIRPKDIDSPIMGEIEAKVVEAVEAEKMRAKERQENNLKRLRPMNATVPGPLGNAERDAMEGLDLIKEEEKERLKNIKKFIKKQRPMETIDQESALGKTEALTVGFIDRVKKQFQVNDKEDNDDNKAAEEEKTVATAVTLELPSKNEEGEEICVENVNSNNNT